MSSETFVEFSLPTEMEESDLLLPFDEFGRSWLNLALTFERVEEPWPTLAADISEPSLAADVSASVGGLLSGGCLPGGLCHAWAGFWLARWVREGGRVFGSGRRGIGWAGGPRGREPCGCRASAACWPWLAGSI